MVHDLLIIAKFLVDWNPPKKPIQITETLTKPRKIKHVEFLYSLSKSLFRISIDRLPKCNGYPINGRTWTEFKSKLLRMINIVGKIDKIIVDNGLGFKAIQVQQFWKMKKSIYFTRSTVITPRMQALAT